MDYLKKKYKYILHIHGNMQPAFLGISYMCITYIDSDNFINISENNVKDIFDTRYNNIEPTFPRVCSMNFLS